MVILVGISQALLYVSFSILIGYMVLMLVPSKLRPAIRMPVNVLAMSTVFIPVMTFIPVLSITLYIGRRLGFFEALKIVLMTHTIGTAWCATLLLSIVLFGLIIMAARTNSIGKVPFALVGVLVTIGLVFTVAWSSHAGAVNPALGILSDFIHLLAVSVWVGVILVVGWFSRNTENWSQFLGWFTFVALSCLGATAISGFLLLDVLVDGYSDAWMVSYGQGLLMKHLMLIPLIFYALVNGLFVKYKVANDSTFNPLPGVRVEGFILLTIFMLTAFFSQQSPPHGYFLTSDAVSPLFKMFHSDVIDASSTIGFVGNGMGIALFFGSIILYGLQVLAFFKKAPILISFLISCLFVGSVYVTIMLSITVQ